MTGRSGAAASGVHIRAGGEGDLRLLQDLERAAGEPFRDLGMDAVADDEPPPLALLRRAARADGLWVAVDRTDGTDETDRTDGAADGRPVAYLLTGPVDGNAHIEQVSVHPAAAHRRIGRALIEHVARRERAAGTPALTLCTFADVPWNAPYYARLGFRVLREEELTPGLRLLRAAEARAGLDRWPRVCMRRELTPRRRGLGALAGRLAALRGGGGS